MFHLDLHAKRTRLALRFFIYGVMTITTVVVSSVLFLFALGYRFDDSNLTFEQGGLIQFRSFPDDATILLDGDKVGSGTPAKATVPAGEHEVIMRLDGYSEWRKTVTVAAGQLLWLNYTRFVPNNITTSAVESYQNLHDTLPSPDRRWLALQPAAGKPRLVIADIREEQKPKFETVAIPKDSFTAKDGKHTFQLLEWDLGGRYLLVQHKAKGVNEFIRFDREQPGQAVNLTKKYGAIRQAHFAGDSADVVFARVGSNLLRLQVTGNDSERLLQDIETFVVYKSDSIGYVQRSKKEVTVGVFKNNLSSSVATYPAKSQVKIALSNYFDHDYLAVARGQKVELYRDPTEAAAAPLLQTFRELSLDTPPAQWVYFSNNGRMLVAQYQGSFTTYDLETDETHTHSFAADQKVTERFQWLDDYYLWVDVGGTLRIVEFDGTNGHVISSVAKGYGVTLSEDGNALFSIGRNSANNRFELQRSNMVVND